MAYSQVFGNIAPAPASVDFNSATGLVSIYAWPGGVKTLVAEADSLDATFTQTSGVPEPATWAEFILGFGLAGVMLRRRRGQTAALPA